MTLRSYQMMRENRRKALVLLAFIVFHFAFSLLFVAPGHLTIDEGVYDLMAREFVTTR